MLVHFLPLRAFFRSIDLNISFYRTLFLSGISINECECKNDHRKQKAKLKKDDTLPEAKSQSLKRETTTVKFDL